MKIEADFVRSAASARDLPRDGLAEIALVGRSNVGKSSLINALVRQRVARTSGEPGKTRLANIYRVARGGGDPLYLVDLPGYGYARAGRQASGGPGAPEGRRRQATREFEELARFYFGRDAAINALLLVDARHPGLDSDLDAWRWVQQAAAQTAVIATKIDKLARGERIRALRAFESVFDARVLPVSAVTGEGLDELWKLIDRLPSSRQTPRPSSPSSPRPPKPTARPAPRHPRS